MTTKVIETEENNRKGRITRTRKDGVGCLQDVVGKKKFLFKFVDGNMRDISSTLLAYVCYKEEVG